MVVVEGGFAAYSKINPFAIGVTSSFGSVSSNGGGFGAVSSSSGATAASNPFAALGKATTGFGKQSWLEGKNLTLTLPSPKSPKHNPFSTPSPVHNPFVTIVNQSQDELWKAMAQNKQLENTNSNHSHDKKNSFRSSSTTTDEVEPAENAPEERKDDEHPAKRVKSTSTDNDEEANGGGGGSDKESDTDSPKPAPVFKASIHLSETVVVSGEEEENCLYQGRAKLYRFKINEVSKGEGENKESSAPSLGKYTPLSPSLNLHRFTTEKAEWCEIGTGPIKILTKSVPPTPNSNNNHETNQPLSPTSSTSSQERERIVMRREEKKGGVGIQLMLNILIAQGTSFARHTENTVRLIGRNFVDGNSGTVINTYLIRFKGKKVSVTHHATRTLGKPNHLYLS